MLAFSLFDAVIFQSKPSVGRATCAAVFRRRRFAFQSKPSVGRATAAHKARHRAFFYFNPRPPWGGRHPQANVPPKQLYFNPRPPWGGRLKISKPLIYNSFISIHALRGEGDQSPAYPVPATITFQSTPSVGRATPSAKLYSRPHFISIHALRGEGDRASIRRHKCRRYFNPRPPWGGRQHLPQIRPSNQKFQSTPSVGRATLVLSISSFCFRISIHALRGEGDAGAAAFISYSQRISIHALRGEGDSGNILWASCYRNFNPRPPWGGRPFASSLSGCRMLHFNPRPPWGGRRSCTAPT